LPNNAPKEPFFDSFSVNLSVLSFSFPNQSKGTGSFECDFSLHGVEWSPVTTISKSFIFLSFLKNFLSKYSINSFFCMGSPSWPGISVCLM